MRSVMLWLFLLSTFCQQLTAKNWSEASEDKCKFTINHEDDILFSENPFLFISKQNTRDLHDCRRLCCNHESCNGYVWDGRDSAENCKLLKCSNEGTDCKKALKKVTNTGDKSSHEVGFITGVSQSEQQSSHFIHPNSTPITATTTSKHLHSSIPTQLSPETVEKLSELLKGITTTSKESEKKYKHFVPQINMMQLIGKSVSTEQKNNTIPSSVDDSKNSTIKPPSNTSKSFTTTPTINPTRRPIQRLTNGVIKADGNKSHSDTVSLTGALLFGIAFLLATVYLVGRRWVESLRDSHKRGYTRISYLLNGV